MIDELLHEFGRGDLSIREAVAGQKLLVLQQCQVRVVHRIALRCSFELFTVHFTKSFLKALFRQNCLQGARVFINGLPNTLDLRSIRHIQAAAHKRFTWLNVQVIREMRRLTPATSKHTGKVDFVRRFVFAKAHVFINAKGAVFWRQPKQIFDRREVHDHVFDKRLKIQFGDLVVGFVFGKPLAIIILAKLSKKIQNDFQLGHDKRTLPLLSYVIRKIILSNASYSLSDKVCL